MLRTSSTTLVVPLLKFVQMTSSSSGNNIHLWVKWEPFVNGILPVPPNPRLSVHYIRKLVTYARVKGEQGYPEMSFSIWRHVACNKLLLPEDIAWMFYNLYELVVDDSTRLEWWKLYHNAENQSDLGAIRSRRTVGLYKFALLLYIQQLNIISLRSSLISAGDEWPTRSRSPSPDTNSVASSQAAKHMDEYAHLHFIMNNLNEMLELLVEPASYGDRSLSVDALEALSMLFDGSQDSRRTIVPIHRLVQQQQLQTKAGYSKITRTYSLRQFAIWIKSCLGQNPLGVTSCITDGRRLSWLMTDDKLTGVKRGKLATNAHLVARETSKGNKLIIMSQVCKETLTKMSSTLEFATIKIHRCHQSFIYLLSPLRTVSIEKCRHSTIVLGPVECAVHMTHCEDVTLITTCHTISISYCQSCTVHLATPTRPLLFNGNAHIILAPYNTMYPQMTSHLALANLSMEPNLWDQPFQLGTEHSNADPTWELMNPSDFYIYTIPFHIVVQKDPADSLTDTFTMGIPSGLPSKYVKALRQRERSIEQWQRTLKAAALTREQKKQFQKLVESRFQAWLVESGCKTELDGLATLSRREKKVSQVPTQATAAIR